jgi:ribonuclease kappa
MPSSVVISVFAIIILSTLGFLYKANHPELVGGDEDPADGAKVAATVVTAVFIYAVSFGTISSHCSPHYGIRIY